MRAAESVEARVAGGLLEHLRSARRSLDDALAAWRSALVEATASRDRANAARQAALAAQLHGDEDEDQLTRRAAEAGAEADASEYAARQAKRVLATVVEDVECQALRARAAMVGMPTKDAERVGGVADDVAQHAARARREARLGPSPEESAERASAALAASERTAPAHTPVWDRLVVTDDDERAVLDGVEYRLPRVAGAKMLRMLLAERGGLVLGKSIEFVTGARPRRELRRLPPPIAELVEAPDRDRRGYRLVDAAATEGRLRP